MDAEVSKVKFEREKEFVLGAGKEFTDANGWEIIQIDFPIIAVVLTRPHDKRRLGFRFTCEGWDEQPPSLTLFDPALPNEELQWPKWPQAGWQAAAKSATNPKPFLCLPGLREYHRHENHLKDLWDDLRPKPGYALRYIVDRVHQKYRMTNG
jgi:hypothetical protein